MGRPLIIQAINTLTVAEVRQPLAGPPNNIHFAEINAAGYRSVRGWVVVECAQEGLLVVQQSEAPASGWAQTHSFVVPAGDALNRGRLRIRPGDLLRTATFMRFELSTPAGQTYLDYFLRLIP